MTDPIRILYVDDEPALLTIGKMYLEQSAEFVVDTEPSAKTALKSDKLRQYDAIISDYQMPGMDGIAFLKEVRSRYGDLPFILFSGRGREEIVIQALNEGADFYLQKGGEPDATYTELAHKTRIAVRHRQGKDALRESEQRYRSLFEGANDAILILHNDQIIDCNAKTLQLFGVTRDEILKKTPFHVSPPYQPDGSGSEERAREKIQLALSGSSQIFEWTHCRPNGSGFEAEISLSRVDADSSTFVQAIVRDITERRQVEQELLRNHEELSAAYEQITATEEELRQNLDELMESRQSLEESEERYRRIVETANEGIWSMNSELVTTFVNRKMADMLGYTPGEMLGRTITKFMDPDEMPDNAKRLENRKQGMSEVYERKFRHKDGSIRWMQISVTAIKDPAGTYAGSFAMISDITERRHAELKLLRNHEELSAAYEQITATEEELRANLNELNEREKALRESKKELADIIEFLPDATFAINANGEVIAWNHAMEVMTGVEKADMLNKGNFEYSLPLYQERRPILIDLVFGHDETVAEKYLAVKRNGARLTAEIFTPHLKNGKGAYLWFTASPLYDSQGTITGAIESIREITEQKKREVVLSEINEELHAANEQITATEEELRQQLGEISAAQQDLLESEERYRAVFENTGTATVVIDENNIISHANAEFVRLSGFSREHIEGKMSWTEFVVRDDLERMLTQHLLPMQNHEKALTHFEFRFVTKSGDIRTICLTIDVIPGTKKSVASMQDISDNKRDKLELQKARDEYTSLLEHIQDVYYRSDAEGRLIIASRSWAKNLGYDDVSECLGKNIADTFYIDPAERRNFLEDVYNYGSVSDYEVTLKKKDKTPLWVSTSSYLCFDESGGVVGVEGTWRDITERRLAGQALRKSEEKYRLIADNTADNIWIFDMDMHLQYISPSVKKMKGFTVEESLAQTLDRVMTPESLASVMKRFQEEMALEALGTADPDRIVSFETEEYCKDGSTILVENSVTLLRDTQGGPAGMLGVSRDITRRKRAENSLNLVNKKLNILSGMTRHDLKNQILSLNAYLEISKKYLGDTAKMSEFIRSEEEITKTIEHLIAFTKEYEALGVNCPIWQDCRTLAETAATQVSPGQIVMKNDIPAGAEVFADPLIIRVFYNLMDNAVRHGGKITTIGFSVEERDREHIIVCEDDGDGIAEGEKDDIFERGFGKNTGLGLYLAREIIDLSGITIRETGEPGRGARFEIRVPEGMYRIRASDTCT